MDAQRDYGTTRGVAAFVSFIGWCVVVVGVIIVVIGFAGMGRAGVIALGPGIGIAVGGLLLVVQGQLLRAIVDTASNTADLVALMRQGSLAQTISDERRPQAAHAETPAPVSQPIAADEARPADVPDDIEIYKGRRIFRARNGNPAVRLNNGTIQDFYSIEIARRYVDDMGAAVPVESDPRGGSG